MVAAQLHSKQGTATASKAFSPTKKECHGAIKSLLGVEGGN